MSRTKEAELTVAVLIYATRCLAEGDHPALRSLNFGTREAEALRGLALADLERLATVHGHCLDVQLDRESYWRIIQHLGRERTLEDIQHALIRADAPFEMMRALFGLDARAYTGQCNLAGVRPTVGRPAAPDEAVSQRLWPVWRARLAARHPEPLSGADYLALHEETGISPRAIWHLVQDWSETEDPGGPRAGTDSALRSADPQDVMVMRSEVG